MFTLRCTQKLLRRLPEPIERSPRPPSTVLGDWYADVVMVGRRPFVLAVSEKTYLAAVVPLKESLSLRARLRDQIGEVLVRLQVGERAFEREMAAMDTSVLAKTASRRAVGVLVEFAGLMRACADSVEAPVDLSMKLSGTPVGPLKMGFPDEVTAELLA